MDLFTYICECKFFSLKILYDLNKDNMQVELRNKMRKRKEKRKRKNFFKKGEQKEQSKEN